MKYLMDDKGNKYLPEDNLFSIETIKEVLESHKYLSDYLAKDIIDTFRVLGQTEIENSEKSSKCDSKVLKQDNIEGYDSDGYLIYKRGCARKSKWNLEQVASIIARLNGDYSNIPSNVKKEIMDRLDLNKSSLKTILHNLKYGELEEMVREWQMKNNYGIKKQSAPIENNPEKRRENGFGGIL